MCGLIEGLIKNNWLDANIDVIAVETSGADCFHQAVKSNQHVTLSGITRYKPVGLKKNRLKKTKQKKTEPSKVTFLPSSIAKTLAAKKCAKQLFDYHQQYRDNIKSLVVSDKQAVDACLKFLGIFK
jgi:threonine dehydratase